MNGESSTRVAEKRGFCSARGSTSKSDGLMVPSGDALAGAGSFSEACALCFSGEGFFACTHAAAPSAADGSIAAASATASAASTNHPEGRGHGRGEGNSAAAAEAIRCEARRREERYAGDGSGERGDRDGSASFPGDKRSGTVAFKGAMIVSGVGSLEPTVSRRRRFPTCLSSSRGPLGESKGECGNGRIGKGTFGVGVAGSATGTSTFRRICCHLVPSSHPAL